MGTEIAFTQPDGAECRSYLSSAAASDAPGVVVIQEWWGLQEQIKGLCDRFALAGFDALAPDLYAGTVVPYHDVNAAGREMASLDFLEATDQKVRGAARFLGRNGAKVGLTGFCLGGAVTVIGCTRITELSAGVVFYGLPPDEVAHPRDVRVPIQCHFASKDDWCTPALVDRLRDRAEGSRQGLRASTATRPITPSPMNSARPCTTARQPNSPGVAPSSSCALACADRPLIPIVGQETTPMDLTHVHAFAAAMQRKRPRGHARTTWHEDVVLRTPLSGRAGARQGGRQAGRRSPSQRGGRVRLPRDHGGPRARRLVLQGRHRRASSSTAWTTGASRTPVSSRR